MIVAYMQKSFYQKYFLLLLYFFALLYNNKNFPVILISDLNKDNHMK